MTKTYEPDGVTYGTMERTGHAYATCDVCGEIGGLTTKDGDDCPACVAKWEAA
jgi:hypothetical protein